MWGEVSAWKHIHEVAGRRRGLISSSWLTSTNLCNYIDVQRGKCANGAVQFNM